MPVRYVTPFRRRNLLRNTEMRGAVAGNPAVIPGDDGVLPNDFVMFEDPPLAGNNIDFTNQGVVTENGLRRLTLAFTSPPGGSAGAGNVAIALSDFVNPRLLRVRPGSAYAFSFYARLVAAPGPAPSFAIQINEYSDSGQFQAANVVGFTPTLGSLRQQRWLAAGRIQSPLATRIRPILGIYYELGQPFDFSIGIAGPQLERGLRASALQRRFN